MAQILTLPKRFQVRGGDELSTVLEEVVNQLWAPMMTEEIEQLSPSLCRQIQEYGTLMVKAAIERFGELPEWKGRNGCYMCAAEPIRGFPQLIFSVGTPAPEKLFKYWLFSQEKNLRTARYGHTTSFESADEKLFHYGGAVRGRRLLLDGSGFPAHGNEAIILGVHNLVGTLTHNEALAIARKSGNPYFEALIPDIEEIKEGLKSI